MLLRFSAARLLHLLHVLARPFALNSFAAVVAAFLVISGAFSLLLAAGTPAHAAGWQPACNPLVPPPCVQEADPLSAAQTSLHHNYDPVTFNGEASFDFDVHGNLSQVGVLGNRTSIPFIVSGLAGASCTGFAYMAMTGCTNGPAGPQGKCSTCNGNGPGSGVGNPINLATGNKYEEATDFATRGQYPLVLTRSYNSDLNYVVGQGPSYSATNLPFQSRFGLAWRSQYDRYLMAVGGLSTSSNQVNAIRGDGNPVHFALSSGVWYVAYWNPATGWSASTDPRHNVDLRLTTDGTYWYIQDQDDTIDKYDMTGKLVLVTYRGGYTQTFTYDGSGNNTGITDSFGRTLTFTYLANGLVDTMTDPSAGVTHYTYVSRTGVTPSSIGAGSFWVLSTVQYPDGKTLTYLYEDNTNWINRFALTGITDENGNRFATWTYDATTGRATSSQHAGGADLTTITYDDVGNTRTVTNALGKQTVYHLAVYQGEFQIQSIEQLVSTHSPAATVTYAYDSNGYAAQRTSGEGRVNKYVNNAIGQETSRTEGYGSGVARTITTTWNTTWREPDGIVQPNITTDFTYDTSGRLSQLKQTDTAPTTVPYATNGQTRIWAYTYYGNGLLKTVDGPLADSGDTTTYAYDSSGFVTSVTDVLGHTTTISSNNGFGEPLSSTDANGILTNYSYDLRGRVTGITVNPGAGQAVYGFTYDNAGNLTVVTRPDNSTLTYGYDNAHRVTSVTNNLGESVTYTLDALSGRTATVTRSVSSTSTKQESATFDDLGRVLTNIGAASQTTSHGYDKDNNEVSTTDPRSKVYGHAFDALNRLYQETDPDLFHTTTAFDAQDNPVSVTDARSLTTTYIRDGFGDVIRQVSPDTGTTDFWYDANGAVIKQIDARLVETDFTNDNAGRVQTMTFPAASSENTTYTYDSTAGGNKGVGKLTSVADQSGSTSFVYDTLGRVSTDTRVIAGNSYATGYTYDAAGNILTETYPSGRIVTYTRDALGRISGITTKQNSGASAAAVVSSSTYKPFGPLSGLTFGNGVVVALTYDQDYQLTAIGAANGATTIQNLTNGFDPSGNITSITDNLTSARSQTVTYDNLNRILTASGIYGAQTYAYDGVGNRSSLAVGSTTSSYTYASSANQITAITNTATPPSTGTGSYLYNAFRQRVQKVAGGAMTQFVYDEAGHLLVEANGSGTVQKEYIWLDDMPVAMVDSTGTSPVLYYIHTDQLGTPQKLTDGSMNVVWDGVFDPFGNSVTETSLALTNLRFPGQFFDSETTLNQNWNRDYYPDTGRYIQSDPIGLVGGENTYAYVDGNPVWGSDPSGYCPWCIGALVGAGLDLSLQLMQNGGDLRCINWVSVGSSAALGAIGGGFGARSLAKTAGKEWSHWIPARYFRPSSPSYKPWLPSWLEGPLNGKYVSPWRHYKQDPFRYPSEWRDWGDKWNPLLQQLDRIPDWLTGSLAGGATAAVVTSTGPNCGCGK
jgi:RHS repeat-associated protein